MNPVLLEVLKQLVCLHGYGDKIRPREHGAQIPRLMFRKLQISDQIFHMQHADHVIDGLLIHRKTGVLFPVGQFGDRLQIGIHRESYHIHPVCHDVGNVHIIKVKYVVDHQFFTGLDRSQLGTGIQHHPDLFFGHFLILRVRINAEQTNEQIRGQRKKLDEGARRL
ncbi:hypothetical protein D1872_234880 [compost metagenome]